MINYQIQKTSTKLYTVLQRGLNYSSELYGSYGVSGIHDINV